MDEQITLTQNQIFSASLKVSKSRSLVKRRMQSLGLKFTESQDVRNRLAGIEKGALKCVGQFCHDNDAESLSAMAIILSELFLLQGELTGRVGQTVNCRDKFKFDPREKRRIFYCENVT